MAGSQSQRVCQAIVVLLSLWFQLVMASLFKFPGVGGLFNPKTYPSSRIQGICALLVTMHGYKCVEFNVETKDGYILSVQRIPGVRGRNGGNRQPVIIQHGLIVDGMTWMFNSPEHNLPMILADNGFDVWIANTRGTRFSRRHKSLSPSKGAFWDWSWDELAQYDLPAVFDFVYARTGNKKIHYVGHSLGTLIALAALSEGKLADKLISVALLSPVAYLSHMTSALNIAVAKSPFGEVLTSLKIAEFDPRGEPVKNLVLRPLCTRTGIECYDIMTTVTGKNCCINGSTVDLVLKYEPQSTSTKNMIHLSQIVKKGRLAKYNYGKSGNNVKHYGEGAPPAYNLSNIPPELPMFISYGGRDALSDPRDVQTLLEILKLRRGADRLTVQFVKDYAHVDFVLGTNANDVVYSRIVAFFTRLNR